MYYLNSFYVYSVIGFIMESTLYKIMNIDNYSGFMMGPVTPVYGMGVLVILIIHKYIIDKINCNKLVKIIITFIICMVLLSILEFIGGFLLDKLLNIELWNYSDKKYNIGKYVCLEIAFIWGLFSVLFIYFVKLFMDKFIKKIPKRVTYCFSIIFLIDLIYTLFFSNFN